MQGFESDTTTLMVTQMMGSRIEMTTLRKDLGRRQLSMSFQRRKERRGQWVEIRLGWGGNLGRNEGKFGLAFPTVQVGNSKEG